MMNRALVVTLLAFGAAACSNAGEQLTYPPLGSGRLVVSAYFDRDGSGTASPGDTTFAGIRFALLAPGGTDTLRTAVANASGIATFDTLPVGAYRLVVDRHAAGDSIGTVVGDTGTVRIVSTNDSIVASRIVGVSYSQVTIATVRTLPAGRRVFVRGVTTVPLGTFADTSMFINDSTPAGLKLINPRPTDGLTRPAYGDSVLVLGTVALAGGEVVLNDGTYRVYAISPTPTPLTVAVTEARTAKAGTIDAQLVQINTTTIRDSATVNGVYILKLSDPADSTNRIDAIIDPALGAPRSFFPIGSLLTIRGVLVPNGTGVFAIKPRQSGDLIF